MSVLVFAESWNGSFKKGTFEAVTFAHDTAKKLNLDCIAVTLGNIRDDINKLSSFGVDKIISVSSDFNNCDNRGISSALAEVAKKEHSNIIIIYNSNTGKSIGPRLSIDLDASFISNVIDIPSKTFPITIKKKAFSGKAFEITQINSDKSILALSPNSYKITENSKPNCKKETFNFSSLTSNIISEKIEKSTGNISLADAEIVISAGRGLKGPENWAMIEELAGLLNAGTACSKPVSDLGWRPHGEHVGQTGKAIAPNLYIAIGISGAIQHLAGVNSSKIMVAINTDPDAPFFKAADYGIVGDAFDVVPRLIEEIKNFKANN